MAGRADAVGMANGGDARRTHEADRVALTEATTETLEVYAHLADRYDDTIARQNELLANVDETLRRVRLLLADQAS